MEYYNGKPIVSVTKNNRKLVTNKYVTFFAGYDTITEEIEMFISGYPKEL